jgi:cysteine desulfurase family protein
MIYLDNAATSHPKPAQVYARMDRFAREVGANPGRAGHRMAVEAEAEIDRTRRQIATLFGGRDPRRLVFTLNATDALNMAFKGLLQKDDHVVTTVMEHNSVARPLNRMESEGTLRVTRVPAGRDGVVDPGDIERALTSRTRLVAIAHAGNVLGNVQPIREIGRLIRQRECLFAVDAAQSAGLLPIDVEADRIDLLAFTGHKSLLGPAGTGGLYVGERVTLRPWREGGTGGDSADPMQPLDYPHRLEAGTPNTLGIAGLCEAVGYVTQRGVEAIADHESALALRLWESLEADPRFVLYGPRPSAGGTRTGVVSLNLEGRPSSEIGAILDTSFGIAVRTGLHCAPGVHRALETFPEGTVRVSPGPFTTPEEIDLLTTALQEIAA